MATRARNTAGGGRLYTWGTERYWSVTTILGAIPKDALKWWAAKSVAEFAVENSHIWLGMTPAAAVDWLKREPLRYTAKRADVGTIVHDIAEALALGKALPPFADQEERQHARTFLHFAKTVAPTWIATECEVYHRTHRYAGRFDAIIELDPAHLLKIFGPHHPWADIVDRPIRLLIDHKTGKDIYPEVALQLNAYAGAEFIGAPDGSEQPIPALDGLASLHLRAEQWRLVPCKLDPSIHRTFLYVREVFRWKETMEAEVLGAPLSIEVPPPPAPRAPDPDPDPRPEAPTDALDSDLVALALLGRDDDEPEATDPTTQEPTE